MYNLLIYYTCILQSDVGDDDNDSVICIDNENDNNDILLFIVNTPTADVTQYYAVTITAARSTWCRAV